SIPNFSLMGLAANSILSFASCLAKGTNSNAAKNNIIRSIMVTIFFVAKVTKIFLITCQESYFLSL
ncbi:hypothetical protein, partial [Phascolarctobacterium sp.]|uniref:hypothetical protein n=1 Tax=Phascolarctobacterium sp. TaxID=2049039 RepID=UPI0025EE2D01